MAAADSLGLAERHGFDLFQLVGATQQATLSALAALDADHDPRRLAPHIATLTTLLDTWRTLEVNAYITFYDAILGRLLIATGQPEQAGHRLNTGLQLAEDIGMCFYDAELLRLRAHAQADPDARNADIAAALSLLTTRARPSSNCAPRWTISTCAVSPPAPLSPTPLAASPPTARCRNWHAPGRSWIKSPMASSNNAAAGSAAEVLLTTC